MQEIPPEEWATVEGKPGTPRYAKARQDFISSHLDRRIRKAEEVPADPAAPAPPAPPAGLTGSAAAGETAAPRRVR